MRRKLRPSTYILTARSRVSGLWPGALGAGVCMRRQWQQRKRCVPQRLSPARFWRVAAPQEGQPGRVLLVLMWYSCRTRTHEACHYGHSRNPRVLLDTA